VSISKCWVDLYGSSVALESSLNILHFLKSITHVAVSICKCWLDPKKRKEYCYLKTQKYSLYLKSNKILARINTHFAKIIAKSTYFKLQTKPQTNTLVRHKHGVTETKEKQQQLMILS
jgi:hypothetical protein